MNYLPLFLIIILTILLVSGSVIVNILVLVLIVLFLLYNHHLSQSSEKFESAVKTLVIQASRWSIAAEQDKNAFIANLHANYGVGYVSALRQIASDNEIKKITNVNAIKFEKEIVNTQRRASQKLMKECPAIIPKGTNLALLSQLEI